MWCRPDCFLSKTSRNTPGWSLSWQTSSICSSPAYAMAAVTAGNSAGAPRCCPPVHCTPSNQKNGPTPVVRDQDSMAVRRSGTTQHTCMKFLPGKGGAVVNGVSFKESVRANAHGMAAASADQRETLVIHWHPRHHVRGVEVGAGRSV